jgi:hypothetical protein
MSMAAIDGPCVFCGAECVAGEWYHAAECPSVTGLFPVREGDLKPYGMVCCECEGPFVVGDFYVHRTIDPGSEQEGLAGAAVVDVVCIGCGLVPLEEGESA